MSEDPWDDWETAADAGVSLLATVESYGVLIFLRCVVNWLWYTQTQKNTAYYYCFIEQANVGESVSENTRLLSAFTLLFSLKTLFFLSNEYSAPVIIHTNDAVHTEYKPEVKQHVY